MENAELVDRSRLSGGTAGQLPGAPTYLRPVLLVNIANLLLSPDMTYAFRLLYVSPSKHPWIQPTKSISYVFSELKPLSNMSSCARNGSFITKRDFY
jgi:hypothetical protein